MDEQVDLDVHPLLREMQADIRPVHVDLGKNNALFPQINDTIAINLPEIASKLPVPLPHDLSDQLTKVDGQVLEPGKEWRRQSGKSSTS